MLYTYTPAIFSFSIKELKYIVVVSVLAAFTPSSHLYHFQYLKERNGTSQENTYSILVARDAYKPYAHTPPNKRHILNITSYT